MMEDKRHSTVLLVRAMVRGYEFADQDLASLASLARLRIERQNGKTAVDDMPFCLLAALSANPTVLDGLASYGAGEIDIEQLRLILRLAGEA